MGAISGGPAHREHRLAGHVLVLGAAFGVLGDGLFFRSGVGLNALLWFGTLALVGWMIHRRAGRADQALPVVLAVGAFFAACLGWRASPFLRFWDLVAVAATVVLIATRLRGPLLTAPIAAYGRSARAVAADLAAAPLRLAGTVPWSRGGPWAPAVAKGLVLAVPVLAVFGALLAAADPAMDAFLRSLVAWDPETVVAHLGIFGATAWPAAGGLWRLGLAPAEPRPPSTEPAHTLGTIELGIPLGALILLLTAFIGLQTRYLFGGEAFVQLTGLTYAQFARRGFFELVALCALAVPVLLGAQHLVDRRARQSVESFRALAPAIVLLLLLVMVSALARMRLYMTMYGLTEDRFYATAFMLWLGLVLAWFLVTELGGWLERFATGAVASGFLCLAGLNAVNPDAVVARVNLGRAATVALDATYLGRLSRDAIPTLAASWSTLDAQARCDLRATMVRATSRDDGWRAWTWSGWRAARSAGKVRIPEVCPEE